MKKDIISTGTTVAQNPAVQSALKTVGLWFWGKISGMFSK